MAVEEEGTCKDCGGEKENLDDADFVRGVWFLGLFECEDLFDYFGVYGVEEDAGWGV